jgi:hypothetical protein
MISFRLSFVLIFALLWLAGCSSTVMTGSWKDPDFTGQVKTVYIIGMSKEDTARRIFEDDFRAQLATYGVVGIPSYNELPFSKEIDQEIIAAKARAQGADSIILARTIGKRTEEVVNPGYVSRSGFDPHVAYFPDPYYRHYGTYYRQSYNMIYQPATVSQYEVVTIEANLYDVTTSQLIWSAQLETVVEGNLQALIDGFVETVTKDLKAKGLI